MEFGEASLLRPALPPGIDGIGIAHAVARDRLSTRVLLRANGAGSPRPCTTARCVLAAKQDLREAIRADGDKSRVERASELLVDVSLDLRQVTRELHPSVLDEAGPSRH